MVKGLIKRILAKKYTKEAVKSFTKDYLKHPLQMSQEVFKFISNSLGFKQKPKEGLICVLHGHTNFSDGPELRDIVNILFKKKVSIWSPTDHDNSDAFDGLMSGEYDLGQEYRVVPHQDGRSLSITSKDHEMVVLRSIEKLTTEGEVGIHGYSGTIPKEEITLDNVLEEGKEGFTVINHPFYIEGVAYHSQEALDKVVRSGAIAVEKNATEIPPIIYGPMRARILAEELNLPLVPGEDAHTLDAYGNSGMVFRPSAYNFMLKQKGNHSDTVREMIRSGEFDTFFNYITFKQLFDYCIFNE